jgi:hypothetical protein
MMATPWSCVACAAHPTSQRGLTRWADGGASGHSTQRQQQSRPALTHSLACCRLWRPDSCRSSPPSSSIAEEACLLPAASGRAASPACWTRPSRPPRAHQRPLAGRAKPTHASCRRTASTRRACLRRDVPHRMGCRQGPWHNARVSLCYNCCTSLVQRPKRPKSLYKPARRDGKYAPPQGRARLQLPPPLPCTKSRRGGGME